MQPDGWRVRKLRKTFNTKDKMILKFLKYIKYVAKIYNTLQAVNRGELRITKKGKVKKQSKVKH